METSTPVIISVLDFLSPLVDLSVQKVSLSRLAHDPEGLLHGSHTCLLAPPPSLSMSEIVQLDLLRSRAVCECADKSNTLWGSLAVFDPLPELARDLPPIGSKDAEFFAATMLALLAPSRWVPTTSVSYALDLISTLTPDFHTPSSGALFLVCRGSHVSLPTSVTARLPFALHHDVRGFSLLLEPDASSISTSSAVILVAPEASATAVLPLVPLFSELLRDGAAGFDPETAYAAANVLTSVLG